MNNILNTIKWVGTAIGGIIGYLFGGFDVMLKILIILAVFDYSTGILAAIYTSSVSSEIGFKGIIKKTLMFAVVAVGNVVGIAVGLDFIRTLVIAFYIANEGISILENVSRCGVPFPKKLLDVLKQLKEQKGEGDNVD